ncbi:hypothetical protein O3G_MSEX009860 [Manduca sexta]|uniref:PHD-type domain-containing protein n=1 Tax=Manduca sexta TaxID=7130 RepID=A0A921ZFR1_MANSE|nr:hypothetical protein O3G_MSEX009860 [Manduca sexta]
MSVCRKCSKRVKAIDLKLCSKCNTSYHYQCIGVLADIFSKESKAHKAAWKCMDCKSSDESVDRVSTPPHNTASTPNPVPQVAVSNEDLKRYIDKKLEQSLAKLLSDITCNFQTESSDTRTKIQELTDCVNFMSTKYDQLAADLEIKSKTIEHLESLNLSLQNQVISLNDRLDHFEQQSRNCNLELQCVPEHKSENLRSIVQQLTTTVGCSLPDHEISKYHRVAKFNRESNRPRSIIVKLSSPLVRDRVLAAVKTFNRTHRNNKLNSSHIGLAGDKKSIFVCEHLSPTNKHLHAVTRKIAKEKNYKFVWTRNGRIYMRKDLNSKSIWIKDADFLNSL